MLAAIVAVLAASRLPVHGGLHAAALPAVAATASRLLPLTVLRYGWPG